MTAFLPGALPDGFKQGDAGGDRDVETADGASHRQGYEVVAVFPGEAPEAAAFGAHGDGKRAFEVLLIDAQFGVVGRADDPDAPLLQRFHAASQIGDAEDGHGFGGTTGDLADGGINRG